MSQSNCSVSFKECSNVNYVVELMNLNEIKEAVM